jgi:hypothetical protein
MENLVENGSLWNTANCYFLWILYKWAQVRFHSRCTNMPKRAISTTNEIIQKILIANREIIVIIRACRECG